MAEWPLVELTAVACLAAITAYVLFAGADFGGGVWDLFATGPRARRQRALIADTIGPIWEANHVWLILVVVILFTGFPVESLLVEGKTDGRLIPRMYQKIRGRSLATDKIGVVELDGSQNIPGTVRVLRAMGLQVVTVADLDFGFHVPYEQEWLEVVSVF